MSDTPSHLQGDAAELSALESARWRAVNFAQALFLVSWTALMISAALLALALTWSTRAPLWMARHCWAPPLLKVAGAQLEVSGLEHIAGLRSAIFMSNHQSMIDIPVAFAALPVNIRFVAKRVLLFVPFLGWYMWAMGMVFVDRGRRAQAIRSLQRAAALVRNDAFVMTFPEGTRSLDGRTLPFKKGLFVLAMEAGVPIVPMAIEGAQQVLPTNGFQVRPGKIRVALGEPVQTAGRSLEERDALIHEVRSRVIDLNCSLGGAGGDRDDAVSRR